MNIINAFPSAILLSVFLLVGCQFEKSTDQPMASLNDTTSFYDYDLITRKNKKIIKPKEKDLYGKSGYRLEEIVDYIPYHVTERLSGALIDLGNVITLSNQTEILAIGHPAWDRARMQGYEDSYALLIPLVKENSTQTEGILYMEYLFEELKGVTALPREDLLAPILEARIVESYEESLLMYDVASFDNFLFGEKFLPSQYALDVSHPDYEADFLNGGDKNYPEIRFLRTCTSITISFEGQSITRWDCESRTIITRGGSGGRVVVVPGSGGGSLGATNNNDDDNDANNDDDDIGGNYCEWKHDLANIYSGDLGPIQDQRDICYLAGETLIDANYCVGSVAWDFSGICDANIDVKDDGTRVFPPVRGSSNLARTRFKLRLVNNASINYSVAPLIGGSEWSVVGRSSSIPIKGSKIFPIGERHDCYVACRGL